ncbi:hypothetical protein B0H16DRAFT_1454624 [Mycena metata]|uniref:Uncharacterized protein n=1 Tax=Mycena metata TaxID=1033252 RepID=A0AAD7NKL7_9AGAR|nr:hypothetical protein B0H16DRAFT_1454624 [Mycena metata]
MSLARKCGHFGQEYSGIVFFAALAFSLAVVGVWNSIAEGIPSQKKLLSRVTSDTPISGFYGPGTWWAWLITLGLSHAHTGMALLTTGELPSGWDYDLIGVSFYTVLAAVDLMHKSRAIAQLGDKASGSVLLPALVCAERVVSIGTGSSLFSVTVALLSGGFSDLRKARTLLCITTIPLVFSLVASGFTSHVHQVILQTAPVFWCSLHPTSPPSDVTTEPYLNSFNFTLVDFLALWTSVTSIGLLSTGLLSSGYWMVVGYCTVSAILIMFISTWVCRQNVRRALRGTAFAGAISVAIGVSMPLLTLVLGNGLMIAIWFYCWIFLWWAVYVLAFFPQMGYFPPTGMSVFEMDQMAALLGVVLVVVIRVLRRIYKAKVNHSRSDSPSSSLEFVPLLHRANGEFYSLDSFTTVGMSHEVAKPRHGTYLFHGRTILGCIVLMYAGPGAYVAPDWNGKNMAFFIAKHYFLSRILSPGSEI